MFSLKILFVGFFVVHLTDSMYYLTNFHTDYPHAQVIIGKCGDTVLLSCHINVENFSLSVPTMWFRLYENAYPQPLTLGDRQLIDDQRFLLRTQNHHRHLEINRLRKDDQGYYLCKAGNDLQFSYNLTVLTNTCIDIHPNQIHVNIDEPFQLICRIRSWENFNENPSHFQWTRNGNPFNQSIESKSNYSLNNEMLYDTLRIKQATSNDAGNYFCQYGELLTATAHVIVNQNPSGSKSRRLISQLRGNSSSSGVALRTVVNCFYIVCPMVLVTLVLLS